MNNKNITIIDYGMGNLYSVINALNYLGYNPIISSEPQKIIAADSLLLPGVGSFHKAMVALVENGLDQAILEAVQIKKRKILGICLGMQLMGISSTEEKYTEGLKLINTSVDKFTTSEVGTRKIPHVGFDSINSSRKSNLLQGLPPSAEFYFVHSYRMSPSSLEGEMSTCCYGINFLAAYEQENIFATQFHPEKSQTNGLKLLKNFMNQ
jgi:glutamine amidotransferase